MFNVNEDEVKSILKSLSLMNIVKKLSKDTLKVELEELLDIDTLDELNAQMEGNIYLFKYVGILLFLVFLILGTYIDKFSFKISSINK